MQTVYLVEDDEDIKELVLYMLRSQYAAEGYLRPADFWLALKDRLPDLVLLDIMLPDEDGISILKRLKTNGKTEKIPVIMLTAKTSEYDRVKGLDLGADDYISKPFSVLELMSRVKAVLRRSAAEPTIPEIVIGNVCLYPQKRMVTVDGEPVTLTYKEFSLLQLLMENRGDVCEREKIVAQIWGSEFEGESRTIDMHIKTMRQKLGPGGSIIKTVRGAGYKAGE